MLSEKLLNALNDQVQFEFDSANLYLAMAAYLANEELDGFAHFFKVQYEEEKFHALKFFDFINEMDGRVIIKGLSDPSNNYDSPLDVFEKALAHEKEVTKRIYNLMDLAMAEKEHATISFLKWFIDEQVEEENSMKDVIKKLKRIGEEGQGLFILDAELAQRTFVPPTEESN